MLLESSMQYEKALKAGQKYYKNAVGHGRYPYPLVLDEILESKSIAATVEVGYTDIPSKLIIGTKNAGRTSALAGNFMPLLPQDSEFCLKWCTLCDAHLGEGIRDAIKCFEYLGKFYIQEGNKRASVLMSYGAPSIPAMVTRIVPIYNDADEDVVLYYEFLHFYSLSKTYGLTMSKPGNYQKLQAQLGLEKNQQWTLEQRKKFQSAFLRFEEAFEKVTSANESFTAGDALVVWLKVFKFADIREQGMAELCKNLQALLPDVRVSIEEAEAEVLTDTKEVKNGIVSKILKLSRVNHLNVAYIYGNHPEKSYWTRAHDNGRAYMQEKLGEKVTVRSYVTLSHDFYETMENAVDDGAELIIATLPQMVDACRRISLNYPNIRVLNCALAQPYTGVRQYHSRIFEAKFITGAIAGAMADTDDIGYVADYPIIGTPASINAFALGVRLTNPRARIHLAWTCLEKDPVKRFQNEGITVISNQDSVGTENQKWSMEWGTYKVLSDGEILPLGAACWNWGKFYEQIVLSIFNGAWEDTAAQKPLTYWWGLNRGVIDIKLSEAIPEGLRTLAMILKSGEIEGRIDPFHTVLYDQNGVKRNDGTRDFTTEELMEMDWLCDSVDGSIPGFDELDEDAKETVRILGIYRKDIQPAIEGEQL